VRVNGNLIRLFLSAVFECQACSQARKAFRSCAEGVTIQGFEKKLEADHAVQRLQPFA
jgi:hypothetical protein